MSHLKNWVFLPLSLNFSHLLFGPILFECNFPCMAYKAQMKVQPPQYTRQPQSQPINDISKEKSICLAFLPWQNLQNPSF